MFNTKKIVKAIKIATAGIVVSAGILGSANAQKWDNTGGTYKGGTTGKIKMRGTAPTAQTGCATEESGTIVGIGTSDATRIDATVVWSKPAGADQQVQTGLYFENLYVEGNPKNITDVFVSGIYDVSGMAPTGTVAEQVANIKYDGNFTYDGTGTGLDAQNIVMALNATAGGTGTAYSTLTAVGGEKVIDGTTTVEVGKKLDVQVATVVNNSGTLKINNTADVASTIAGTVNVDAATGIFNIQAPATAPVQIDAAGKLELLATATNPGALTMGAGSRLEVGGTLSNLNTLYNNTALDASGNPSTVAYNNAGDIMPVICENPYGRLEFMAAANRTLSDNVFIAGQASDALYFPGSQNYTSDPAAALTTTDAFKVKFIHPAANATYTNYNAEVIGWVERAPACATTTASIAAGTTYLFHNHLTALSFNAAGGTDLTSFALQSLPATLPSKRQDDHGQDSLVVSRQYQADYVATGAGAEITNMKLGFKASEITANDKDKMYEYLRLSEGYLPTGTYAGEVPQNIVLADGAGAAVKITKDPATISGTWLSVNQASAGATSGIKLVSGGTAPGVANELFNTSQIVINSTPDIFMSVTNGRWSNPAVWNNSSTPRAIDRVVVRHQVYTGLYAAGNLFGSGPYDKAEDILATGEVSAIENVLADQVLISTANVTGWPNISNGAGTTAALIIGNEVQSGAENMNFATKLAFGHCGTGITVDGSASGSTTDPDAFNINDAVANNSAAQGIKGLFVMKPTGTAGNNQNAAGDGPIIRATNLTNKGSLSNSGTVEVGN